MLKRLGLVLAYLAASAAFLLPAHASAPTQIRVAVLLVNFSDDVRQPWTTGYISSLYFGAAARSVSDFYQQASWGHTTVTGDVSGWYQLAQSSTGCDVAAVATQADAAATAAGVDLDQYTNKVYLFPYTVQCNFAGLSYWPGAKTWLNFDPTNCAEGAPNCSFFHVLPHELGHNLGLDHAGSSICTDGIGAHVVLSNTCTDVELGDTFDDMGCCQPALFPNVNRLMLGWIPLSQMVTITQTGTYTISPVNNPTSLVYRVADGTGQYLYFENRAFSTAYEPGGAGYVYPDGNLLVRRAPDINPNAANQPMTKLLDCSPADNDTNPYARGCPVGSNFTLPNAPVTVTNQAWDGTNNTIQVTVGTPPPPLAQCQDGIDNDRDGKIDYPADKQCTSPTDNDERHR